MALSTARARLLGMVCTVALTTLLIGCSGASNPASTSSGASSGASVQGVATPSSVSVVTAN